MTLVDRHPVLEEILDGHADRAGDNARGYAGLRAHAYRVFNFSRELASAGGVQPDDEEKLAIAAGFHDLGAFASLDYLGPAIAAMTQWLEASGRGPWREELSVVCAHHHKLTAYRGPHARLTEPFRRADWCARYSSAPRATACPGR
ncbi:MAG: HD domain-containing protein [Sporichthyaceae bacterium]